MVFVGIEGVYTKFLDLWDAKKKEKNMCQGKQSYKTIFTFHGLSFKKSLIKNCNNIILG